MKSAYQSGVSAARKYTPGPWEIWTSCSFRRISSQAAGGDGDVLHAVVQRSNAPPDLCFPNGGFTGPDARLIAAAPELLEALIECHHALESLKNARDSDYARPDDTTIEQAGAAIDKAIGSAQ